MKLTMTRAVAVAAATLAGVLSAVTATAGATDGATAARLAGDDRHATAAAVAAAAFPDGATAAVLARGDAFPDALAGAALAASVRGPVLLTPRDSLAPQTSEALDALGVGTVYLLGGPGAVSDAVAAELRTAGREVIRVAGDNRYATAAAVARRAGSGDLEGESTAIVASGASFPDALAAGPLAAGAGLPILLTPPDHLASEAAAALDELGIEHVLVLGGSAAVSDAVTTQIRATGARVERLAGASRAETAVIAADFASTHLGWTSARVLLARADEFADGLAGGPLGGRTAAPVLLTAPDGLDPATASWLGAHRSQVELINVLGGTGAVSDAVVDAAVDAAQNGVAAGAGGAALAVTPTEPATVPLSQQHTCAVDAGVDTHVLVLPASAVTSDGEPHFADADADGVADTGGTSVRIVEVDGRTLSPPVDRLVVDAAADLAVASSELSSAVVVAFVDDAGGTDGGLDLDEDGSAAETTAVGCAVTFAPEGAAAGAYTGVEVVDADGAASVFVVDDDSGSFAFDADDAYAIQGRAGSVTEFGNAVSRGDLLDIDYVPGGKSTFELVQDTVLAPDTVVATATVLDDGAEVDDVSVDFAVPDANGLGTRYTVTRSATSADGDGCSSAIVGTATTEGTTPTSPFGDLDVAEGCYVYRILAVSSAGTSALSDISEPVKTPGTPVGSDGERPTSVWAQVTTSAGRSGELDAGDVVTIVFDEPLAPPSSPSMSVRSASGGSTTIGGSLASFTLNDAATSVGGISRPARTVLTVKVLGAPSPTVALPTDVVGSAGIVDTGGLAWDIAASADHRLGVS